MKYTILGLLTFVLVFHLSMQAVVLSIVWFLNEFAGTYISYWIPAVTLVIISILILVGWFLLIRGGIKQVEMEEKEFEKERELMRAEFEKRRAYRREKHNEFMRQYFPHRRKSE